MKFSQALDLFFVDMRGEGRINSDRTEVGYRAVLDRHVEDVDDQDPRWTTREDVKRTLSRWPHPNTRRKSRSVLASFYDWAMQEMEPARRDNPARQTRAPKARKTQVYRMTRSEVLAFMNAATTTRERRVAMLGICAGIRNAELRALQRRHFERPGWIHISADIAKGGRERWVPVLLELEPVVAQILDSVGPTVAERFVGPDGVSRQRWVGEYILPAERWRNPGINTVRSDLKLKPASRQVLRTVVMELGQRAGIHARITPHSMRHAFGDHIARYAGMKVAQAMLGHADVGTTQIYTGAVTLDELAAAVKGMRFDTDRNSNPSNPSKAPTRIELVEGSSRPVEPDPDDADPLIARFLGRLQPTIRVYIEHFGGAR